MAKLHYKNNNINSNFYELNPLEGQQKSFYGKAIVKEFENGDKMLYSYDTPIVYLAKCGVFFRLWGGWSSTTSKHIKAFLGKNIAKAEWLRLEVCSYQYNHDGDEPATWGIFSH